jgi:hypothetical protein
VNIESTQIQKEEEEKFEKEITDITFKMGRGQNFSFGFHISQAVPVIVRVKASRSER